MLPYTLTVPALMRRLIAAGGGGGGGGGEPSIGPAGTFELVYAGPTLTTLNAGPIVGTVGENLSPLIGTTYSTIEQVLDAMDVIFTPGAPAGLTLDGPYTPDGSGVAFTTPSTTATTPATYDVSPGGLTERQLIENPEAFLGPGATVQDAYDLLDATYRAAFASVASPTADQRLIPFLSYGMSIPSAGIGPFVTVREVNGTVYSHRAVTAVVFTPA